MRKYVYFNITNIETAARSNSHNVYSVRQTEFELFFTRLNCLNLFELQVFGLVPMINELFEKQLKSVQ